MDGSAARMASVIAATRAKPPFGYASQPQAPTRPSCSPP